MGFPDASLSAYGACVYFKFIKRNEEVNISLVALKSRVAQLKNKQTIPRLELLGNVILCRLLCSIIRCFGGELEFSEIFCYSDSQICLSWIKATHKEYKTFVENRVREIRSAVPPDKWYYCPSDTNPADIITRSNVKNLSNTLWINGPPFLHDSEWSYDLSVCSSSERFL